LDQTPIARHHLEALEEPANPCQKSQTAWNFSPQCPSRRVLPQGSVENEQSQWVVIAMPNAYFDSLDLFLPGPRPA